MSGSDSSDFVKGKNYIHKLLYVQHIDKEKDTTSEISELFLEEYLLNDRKIFSDLNNPKGNFGILKSFLEEKIIEIKVYSTPLPIPLNSNVNIHAYIVFKTLNYSNFKETWWSLEKNRVCIVLQQSLNGDDVIKKLYDTEKKETMRTEPVKELKTAFGNYSSLQDLVQAVWETKQPSTPYNLVKSNCQHFASYVFNKFNDEGKKWSVSVIVDGLGSKYQERQTGIDVNALKYKSIVNDENFVYYRAMIERRRKDFEELSNNLTRDSLNRVDSQGYTLQEWAAVFSTSNWPIDRYLKGKGAEIVGDKASFQRNVFFIALQYLPFDEEFKSNSTKFLSFDDIDINGVNQTGDTALHLALYGEKWDITEKILSRLEDYDVNVTNSMGDTPLLLAVKLKCELGLFKKILRRTNPENVNKTDGNGDTALHLAIDNELETAVKELLQNKDVEVNVKNNNGLTALHLAIKKSVNINAEDEDGRTALHKSKSLKSEFVVRELLNHKDVDVDAGDKDNNSTALHYACEWTNIPVDLFQLILQKSADCNSKNKFEETALHYALHCKSETAVNELLNHKGVNVNAKNKNDRTALHLTSRWTNIPIGLFKRILQRADINAIDIDGNTALQFALMHKSEIVAMEILERDDLDVNVKNNKNETALDLALKWKNIPDNLMKKIWKNKPIQHKK